MLGELLHSLSNKHKTIQISFPSSELGNITENYMNTNHDLTFVKLRCEFN